MLYPVELSGIDYHSSNGRPVTPDIFCQGMHNNIRTDLERLTEIRGGNSTVNNEGHTVPVGNLGDLLDIDKISRRISDGFTKNCPGLVIYTLLDPIKIVMR